MSKVFVIAEAGVNHNGSLGMAMKLIDAAVYAGADAVKFQTFKANKIVSKGAKKADYQIRTDDASESQYEMLRKLEINEEEHRKLIAYCEARRITFLSTPFDHDSIDLLDNLGLLIFKIPSGEITNLPYLRHVGSLGREIILSTGMSDLGEVEDAMKVLAEAGTKKGNIVILHATTEYPCPMAEVNLKAMSSMSEVFDVRVGYSDHTVGIEVPVAAVAMGASVIEKHFTLDKTMDGPDHKASLEPDELKAMVAAIRNVEKALGDGLKKSSLGEDKNKKDVRKSIVAARDIRAGEIFTEENITTKRPGNGISPMRWDEVIGTEAQKDYNEDMLI